MTEIQFLIGLRVICGLLGQARSIEEESFSQKFLTRVMRASSGKKLLL